MAVSKRLPPDRIFKKTIPVNRWAIIKTAGRYLVTGVYSPPGFTGVGQMIRSRPIRITVVPLTEEQLRAHIANLQQTLNTATKPEERRRCSERLAYTASPDVVPILLVGWYQSDGFWEAEALMYYVPHSHEIKAHILKVARRRGLASGMQPVLEEYGVTPEEMFPLIERSLAVDNPGAWAHGALAAQIHSNDAFMARLISIAMAPNGRAREPAIHALALNRTDESVSALRQLLQDPEQRIRDTTVRAIRSAYLYRGRSQGRPLREGDFGSNFRRPEGDCDMSKFTGSDPPWAEAAR